MPTEYTHALLRGSTEYLNKLPPGNHTLLPGNHNVTINGYNMVSNVTEDFLFSIESELVGATSKAYENYGDEETFVEIMPGQEVCDVYVFIVYSV